MNDKRTVPASNFMATIAANVDNEILNAEQFRMFIRNSLPIVIYEGSDEDPAKDEKIDSIKTGKIIISFLKTSADFEKIIDMEQYLNNEVAVEIYRKYNLGLRVHL